MSMKRLVNATSTNLATWVLHLFKSDNRVVVCLCERSPVLPNQSDIGLFYQRNQPGRMGDQRRHKVTLNDVSRNEEVGKWALRLILS